MRRLRASFLVLPVVVVVTASCGTERVTTPLDERPSDARPAAPSFDEAASDSTTSGLRGYGYGSGAG